MQAERGYKQGLLMYPKSPPLLRSYAQFMQDIKLNPHASMRYYVEADKLDAQQQEVSGSPPDQLPSMASASPESYNWQMDLVHDMLGCCMMLFEPPHCRNNAVFAPRLSLFWSPMQPAT